MSAALEVCLLRSAPCSLLFLSHILFTSFTGSGKHFYPDSGTVLGAVYTQVRRLQFQGKWSYCQEQYGTALSENDKDPKLWKGLMSLAR